MCHQQIKDLLGHIVMMEMWIFRKYLNCLLLQRKRKCSCLHFCDSVRVSSSLLAEFFGYCLYSESDWTNVCGWTGWVTVGSSPSDALSVAFSQIQSRQILKPQCLIVWIQFFSIFSFRANIKLKVKCFFFLAQMNDWKMPTNVRSHEKQVVIWCEKL